MNKKIIKPTDNLFRKITRVIVKDEINTALASFESRLLEAFDKKLYEMRSDNAKMKDQIVGELQTIRDEMSALNAQHQRVLDHEGRLENLEKIHPQGIHVAI